MFLELNETKELNKIPQEKPDLLLLSCPAVIILEIFMNLLSSTDLCRFDSAVLSKKDRPLFLRLIKSKEFTWEGKKDLKTEEISWIGSKSIKMKYLKCSFITNEVAIKIGMFGSLPWLTINNGCMGDNSMVKLIEGRSDLLFLSLVGCRNINGFGLIKLGETCLNLSDLSLSHCNDIKDSTVAKMVQGCRNLKAINLSECWNVTSLTLMSLAKQCPLINTINLSNCRMIRDIGINNRDTFPVFSELHDLNLSGCTLLSSIGRLPKIRKLDLDRCFRITNSSILQLAETSSNLQSLNLKDCTDINDEAIVKISNACPQLFYLNLYGIFNITDRALISLTQCPCLSTLQLQDCSKITDVGVMGIAKACHKLCELDISSCVQISDSSLICMVENCFHIQNVYLHGCVGTSSIGRRKLKEHCVKLINQSGPPLSFPSTNSTTK